MCIVEIAGIRGVRTACTTKVEPGMVIQTNTDLVNDLRREILRLILSEHTSSCLICEVRDECAREMASFKKGGVTTGCRSCPADNRCELQTLTEQLGVSEIKYPVYYRHLPVEKYDPFYDRDYNICILCGRCIRVCAEIRGANTLTFKERGYRTVVGTAFDRSHMDAGCEFCGACVSVCPTGALAERSNKWDGKAEREEVTTCALCGVGCQLRLRVKRDRVMGSEPDSAADINAGQLCLKGRFCINELVNTHKRVKKPSRVKNGVLADCDWEEALDTAARKLSDCPPEKFVLRVSPNCSNEDLYIAQKFSRVVMRSNDVETSAREFYDDGFGAYVGLLGRGSALSELDGGSTILCVGLDTRFGRSVVNVHIRRAKKQGAKLISVNPDDHNLAYDADVWVRPEAKGELKCLRSLLKAIATATDAKRAVRKTKNRLSAELAAAAALLNDSPSPTILVGPGVLHQKQTAKILETIDELAGATGAKVLALPAQNNFVGSILMGADPGLLPGGLSSRDGMRVKELGHKWGADINAVFADGPKTSQRSRKKVLYLVGEAPPAVRKGFDFVLCQDTFRPGDPNGVDLVLPSAAFTEADGTYVNGEGRILRGRKAVEPPGDALPDWEILCRIARKMGASGFDFSNAKEIRDEIASFVARFGDLDGAGRKAAPVDIDAAALVSGPKRRGSAKPSDEFPFVFETSVTEHVYRGSSLAAWVGGAADLFREGALEMNPEDARNAGISEGDEVLVTAKDFENTWPVTLVADLPAGTLHATLRRGEWTERNPAPVRIRKKDV